jgi:hypothetical protein
MDFKTPQKWWYNISPLTRKQLQIKYYPAINWRYLNRQQVFNIYAQEQITAFKKSLLNESYLHQ